MKLKKFLSNKNGFTLIEILVSLTILGIILIGIMNFFSQAYSYTNSNQNKTTGINVARNAMMFMEKQSFIEIEKNFEDNPTTNINLLICQDQYKMFWGNDVPDPGCNPIKINNIDYNVTVLPNLDEEYKSFIIPIIIKVDWQINHKTDSTKLEGAIKSEDIR